MAERLYRCPFCQWEGTRAKEEKYCYVQGGKLQDGYRYICPECRMDTLILDDSPQITRVKGPRTPRRGQR